MNARNDIAAKIVDAAFKIHKTVGPGLPESVYETLMAHELAKRELQFARQQMIPVVYEQIQFEEGFRADLVVESKVIVELKSVETIAPIHKKQPLTYLSLADKRLGLLINFGDVLFTSGITRVVNNLEE